MKYRVWCDPNYNKSEREDRDGEDHEAGSPQQAAEAFAGVRYSRLQHIDPGVFLVRDADMKVTRWSVRAKVSFLASSLDVAIVSESKGKPAKGDPDWDGDCG